MPNFQRDESASQLNWLAEHLPDAARHARWPILLAEMELNLHPAISADAISFFDAEPVIQWHTYAGHGRSSQAACVNFLMPMADKPGVLSRWVGHVLGITPPEMLVIEQRAGRDWYMTFEWIGTVDYLGEAGPTGNRGRGANATAADAALMFRDDQSKVQLLLIEWKYTEEYRGHRLSPDLKGKRQARYADISGNGPIDPRHGLVLADFLYEPFYQLLRQQMLAWRIEHDPTSGVDRARVLHLSPGANVHLHNVTAHKLRPFADDAFHAFSAVLKRPNDFVGHSIEDAFALLTDWPDADWFPWLQARYASLCGPSAMKQK